MANREQVALLKSSVIRWNAWREKNPDVPVNLHKAGLSRANLVQADLSHADLSGTNLSYADLSGTNLGEANLVFANLMGAKMRGTTLVLARLMEADVRDADLSGANLGSAVLAQADMSGADLTGADMRLADLNLTNMTNAILCGANLQGALLIHTKLLGAKLNDSLVYGISAWDLEMNEQTEQSNLVITWNGQPAITVDNLKVAQFLYLFIHNSEIRDVIDTMTSKVVLILGRFSEERKPVLDALRDELGKQKDSRGNQRYIPVMFDFDRPFSQDFLEPVRTLAHLARFVIADLTDPRIILEEIPAIVQTSAVPLQPLLLVGQNEPVTLANLRINHRSVLKTFYYQDTVSLLAALAEHIIGPAEDKRAELSELRLLLS